MRRCSGRDSKRCTLNEKKPDLEEDPGLTARIFNYLQMTAEIMYWSEHQGDLLLFDDPGQLGKMVFKSGNFRIANTAPIPYKALQIQRD